MFTDKNTETSEVIMRNVKMLLECVNSEKMTELRKRSRVRHETGRKKGESTDDATEARTEYIQFCARTFETFYFRYTSLFYLIVDEPEEFNNNGPSMKKLKKFINLKDRVEITKDVTHKEVSEQIGKEAYEKYVTPIVKDLEPSSK